MAVRLNGREGTDLPDEMVVLGCHYEDAESAEADLAALRDAGVTELALAINDSGEPVRLHGAIGSLADAVLVGLLPGVGLRDGWVRADADGSQVGRLVTRVVDGLRPADLQALVALVHRGPRVLVVVTPEPSLDAVTALTARAADRVTARLAVDADALSNEAQSLLTTVPTPDADPTATALAAPARRSAPELRTAWRVGLVLLGIVLLYSAGQFILQDGGLLIFQLIISWLASIAMEPAVGRLAQHMRRGLATGLVMVGVVLISVLFFAAFGSLLAEQIGNLVRALPGAVEDAIAWINTTFDLSLDAAALAAQLQVSPAQIASLGAEVAGGLLGIIASLVGGVFSMFTIGLFVFYFSADAPRLKRWIARLLPQRRQEVFLVVWDLAVQKTGGYVAARIVLAAISGALTAAFLFIIGMDYWLALGIWTGVVAQFVPTIGTYLAIALPVLVGLTSADPIDGVLALLFALVYQQIENLTLEPKISANAVDMHPAVAFASVLLGAALFGVSGAFCAVPVAALGLALFEIYSRSYELLPQFASPAPPVARAGRLMRRRAQP
ncbi:MAG TPA: AI-2E family transporter [Intrasporangium sp.]|uniref:AI-2E family transporter n=1 Tax=Intrasporangium sp. TaxID=1925024 RepID=UPI002F942F9C